MDNSKTCKNCSNRKYRDDGERLVTDTCMKCTWVKVSGNKEPSNWKSVKVFEEDLSDGALD